MRNLQKQYLAALRSYLDGGAETALDQAYEVGRAALEKRLGILDVTRFHQAALDHLLSAAPPPDPAGWLKLTNEILNEALAPFEMSQRGYQETLEQLHHLTHSLEEQVYHRTQDLLKAEENYRTLFESNPLPMGVYDLETLTFLAVNDAAALHYGYSRDEFLSMTIRDLFSPEDLPRLQATLAGPRDVVNTSGPWRHRRKNGAFIQMEVSSHEIRFGGRPARLVLANDITERLNRERELEAIAAASFALREAQTRPEIEPVVLDLSASLLNLDASTLLSPDAAGDELVVTQARGLWSEHLGMRLPLGETLSESIMTDGEPYLNNDPRSIPQFADYPGMELFSSVACIPLVTQRETLGALWVARKEELTNAEVRLLKAICDIAANAIQRAALHEKTEQRLQRIAALHSIDQVIGSSLDLRLTLKIIIEQVISQLGVHAADVLLINPHTNRLEFSAGMGFSGSALKHRSLRLDEGPAGRSAFERRLISIPNLAETKQAFLHPLPQVKDEFAAYFCAPLVSKGQVKGVLEVLHRAPLRPDPEWLDFFETLAGQAAIAIDDATLFTELQRSNFELSLAYDATIEGWSRALDLRDRETEGHTLRVTDLTEQLSRRVGVNESEMVHIHRGALLHDIGKMGVPDSILLKPGPLSADEWVIMRKHPIFAYEMLQPITYLRPALDIPYCHHEKWDGTGYPRGLKGDAIPQSARIFAVVDVWDALCSDRPYRPAWPVDKVREYIRELTGSHFDAQVVQVFLDLLAD